MKAIGFRGIVLCALGLASPASAAPILEYLFNDTGVTTASTGSAPGEFLNLTFGMDDQSFAPAPFDTTTKGFAPFDFHGAAGSGVSGRASDRALDNTFTASGNGGVFGGWALNTTSTALQELDSFTISGWYNRQPVADGGFAPGGGIAMFFTPVTQSLPGGLLDSPPNGFGLRWNNAGAFRYDLSGNGLTPDDSAGTWTDEGVWVFFAETYDSTTGELNLFRGYRNAAEAGANSPEVTLVATMNVSSGTGELHFNPDLSVGYSLLNRGPGGTVTDGVYQFAGIDRSFDALIDNFRIDGSHSDGAGALSLSALEAYRLGDVSLPGDANRDGKVDLADFGILKDHFGQSPADWSAGDFDASGAVDLSDFGLLKANFGTTGVAAVPEPATWTLVLTGVAAFLGLRRRIA
ncbi:MAG: PEP-CTERM sorting domain-containing protein [Pirellulales bacterium]